ncbi:MAG: peptidyl-prolyl cis-trans isomerase SurA [Pseudohongiellaceae bacterium]|jgi:peptidyl-prolyl cis-trans isomerase SurA
MISKHSFLNAYLRPGVMAAALSLLVVTAPSTSLAQRVLLDRIVAVVDDDVVLQSELDRRMAEARGNAERAGIPIPPADQFKDEILEMLVIENLQLQLAERVSIRFDDDTINRVFENMASNNNLSFEQYVATLEENGVYLQTRDEVRRQMTLQELQRGMVNRRITIADQEIENFLNSETGRELMAEDFLVNDMIIPTSETDTPEEIARRRKVAADIVARVRDGAAFNDAAAAAQQTSGIQLEGSSLGWRKASQLPTLFSDIVQRMKIGDIEGPIQAGNGFHVLSLADKRGGTEQMMDQTNIRHIMLAPNEIRDEAQTLAAIESLRAQIEAGADFSALARKNSDDASSVVGGGDLDWVNKGGLPREMEVVIDAMEVAELSEPFRTEMGWHIAEVLGRRETDLSRQYSRSQAENALRNRKFDLELENWILEIREEAFVELVD